MLPSHLCAQTIVTKFRRFLCHTLHIRHAGELENVCLADFVALYTKQRSNEESLDTNNLDEDDQLIDNDDDEHNVDDPLHNTEEEVVNLGDSYTPDKKTRRVYSLKAVTWLCTPIELKS